MWHDQSKADLRAVPVNESGAPKLLLKAFGTYPGISFDGISDKLIVPDASSLQLGTDPFVLELVVTNLSSKCCQQMIFMKEQESYPYAGISVAVNFPWPTTPPPTGEFATFLTLSPDFVSTPISDSDDYRDGKPRVLSILRTTTELLLRVNGRVLGSIASAGVDVAAAGRPLYLGGHPNDSLGFKGWIAEIILARGLTVYEALALDRSLRAKYAEALGQQ